MEHHKNPWLVGTALSVVVFAALSFAAPDKPPGTPPPFNSESGPFPHPRDMVRVVQGEQYQVPAGKILTLREFVATSHNTFGATLAVDGQKLFLIRVEFGEQDALELGITAAAGQVVTIVSDNPGGDPAVAIGFLVDA